MSNFNGWGLSARLVAKHLGGLGDAFAEALASFDPETATEADRDALQEKLLTLGKKFAEARALFEKEHDDVVKLQTLIAGDTAVAETLMARLAKGEVSEATVNLFCDELEANKADLPVQQQEETDAKAFMGQLKEIFDSMSEQLASFDKRATEAKRAMATAKAQNDLQGMRMERQAELSDLSYLKSHSTALDALSKKAAKMSAEAEGMKMVTDINQAPIDRANEVAALRKSITAGPAESTADRLKRLSGK